MSPLAILLAVLGATLLIDTRAKRVLAAYVALTVTIAWLTAQHAGHGPATVAAFAVATALKVAIAPLGILAFLRRAPEAEALHAAVPLPLRVALALLLAAGAERAQHVAPLAGEPLQGAAAFVALCGLGLVLLHRNVLADLLGLLVLGAAVTLEGTLVAPALPETLELGASFDVLVTTVVGLVLLRTLHGRGLHLDEALRSLRG